MWISNGQYSPSQIVLVTCLHCLAGSRDRFQSRHLLTSALLLRVASSSASPSPRCEAGSCSRHLFPSCCSRCPSSLTLSCSFNNQLVSSASASSSCAQILVTPAAKNKNMHFSGQGDLAGLCKVHDCSTFSRGSMLVPPCRCVGRISARSPCCHLSMHVPTGPAVNAVESYTAQSRSRIHQCANSS